MGRLTALHGVLHGLPLTYNKDLQEDKEGLFDASDTLELCLRVAAEMLGEISFHRERMAAAASDEFIAATDVADLLVREGVPFREAHGIVGGIVRAATESHRRLSELSREELAELAPQLDGRFYELLEQGAWLESKVSDGGTALAACATSSPRPATCWPRLAHEGRPRLLRPLGARRGPRLIGCSLRTPGRPAGSWRPRATTWTSPPVTPTRASRAHPHPVRPPGVAYVYFSTGSTRC